MSGLVLMWSSLTLANPNCYSTNNKLDIGININRLISSIEIGFLLLRMPFWGADHIKLSSRGLSPAFHTLRNKILMNILREGFILRSLSLTWDFSCWEFTVVGFTFILFIYSLPFSFCLSKNFNLTLFNFKSVTTVNKNRNRHAYRTDIFFPEIHKIKILAFLYLIGVTFCNKLPSFILNSCNLTIFRN